MSDVLDQRLWNQGISDPGSRRPRVIVEKLGAIQAQEFGPAKWAIGLRGHGLNDADVQQAFDTGQILRTHILRPTWHFVSPRDIRWMLAISGPRVQAGQAAGFRKLELDSKTLSRSRKVIEKALEGGKRLTRRELAAQLLRKGISIDGQRLAYIVLHAELEGLICSGPRRDKQFTYMLLDERVPGRVRSIDRDEALARLVHRYFSSHGPATLRDFVWWSSMTVKDARAGVAMNAKTLESEEREGLTLWRSRASSSVPSRKGSVHLLPIYDEYLISYRDRGALFRAPKPEDRPHDQFAHFLMVDGQLAGTWRRTETAGSVHVSTMPYRPIGRAHVKALSATVERLGLFLDRKASLSID